jgi:hypothetical protein
MPRLIAIDRRLIDHGHNDGNMGTARQYGADHLLVCDRSTPLSEFTSFVARHASGPNTHLEIWCHGLEISGQLGYGLMFCRGGITYSATCGGSLPLLSVLHGRVQRVVLMACGPARIAPSSAGAANNLSCNPQDFGDGHFFCSQMAKVMGSWLEASTERQLFTTGRNSGSFIPGTINYGQREGLWLTYAPSGDLQAHLSRRYS